MTRTQDGHIGLSEVVLRTPHYERLCEFYEAVLRQPPDFDMVPSGAEETTDPDEPQRIAFFNIHMDYPYTQRVAIFKCHDVGGDGRRAVGMHHFQLRVADLATLFDSYQRLKQIGTKPESTYNHGIATSLYYRDPDNNRVELSGMNFDDEADMDAYMNSDAFKSNPAGFPIDPERVVSLVAGGTSHRDAVVAT